MGLPDQRWGSTWLWILSLGKQAKNSNRLRKNQTLRCPEEVGLQQQQSKGGWEILLRNCLEKKFIREKSVLAIISYSLASGRTQFHFSLTVRKRGWDIPRLWSQKMFYQGEPLSPPTGWSISKANEPANENYYSCQSPAPERYLAKQSLKSSAPGGESLQDNAGTPWGNVGYNHTG